MNFERSIPSIIIAVLFSLLSACTGSGETSNNGVGGEPVTDTIAPSKPENLRTMTVLPTSIAISWDASVDNIELAGYRVYKNNVMLSTTTATTFADTTVIANTDYQYSVVAYDMSGNTSMSDPLTVATPLVADTTVPSAPTNLRTTFVNSTSIVLAWNAATDNVAVTGYRVYRGTTLLNTTGSLAYTVLSLTSGTTYQFHVDAVDAAGNARSSASFSASTTTTSDTTAPSAPGSLRTTGITSTSISLAWNAATDNVGVTGYRVFRGTTLVTTTTSLAYTVSSLTASTTYQFHVDAVDAATNTASSNTLTTSTASGDTTGPLVTSTTPANNATRVLTTTSQIIANFNEALAPNSVNTSSYTLSNGITGTVSMANSNTRAVFTPAGQLARGITYTATLNGVTDAAGNALQGTPYTFRFSTCGSTATSTYTVAWNAVTDAELTGYRVYYGTTTLTKNSSHLDVGSNVTSWQLNPVSLGYLPCTTVYVAVTALGSVKGESALSGQPSTSIE